MTHHDRKLTVLHREYGRKAAVGEDEGEGFLRKAAENLNHVTAEMKRFAADAKSSIEGHAARLDDVEQKLARRGSGGAPAPEAKSWGQSLIDSSDFKALSTSSSQRGRARVEIKAITSLAGSGASLIAADRRPDPVMMPQRPLTIRQLLAPGTTSSNAIIYPVQTVRNLNAAPTPEGALKPESTIAFDQKQVSVQTIPHFIVCARQLFDDAPALATLVDSELRYGVDLVEETEMLGGDGTGVHLFGIIPQAQAFAAPFAVAGATAIDVLLQAVAQSELALLPATGIVLHPTDWRRIMGLKDAGGNYLLPQGPFGNGAPRTLWDLPIAASFSLQQGKFLVGAFAAGAQIFDRMETEVEVSSEDSDNFRRNLITIRAEKRLALAVKRPQAFVYGTLPN